MYHIVFIALSATVLGMGWLLVHSAPSIVARILPRTITFILGSFLALVGAFGGYTQAYLDDARGVIGCFVVIVVGLWFMLAPTSGNRGTYRDELMLKRVFMLLGLIFGLTVVTMYLPAFKPIAIANLVLVTGGFWVTTNLLRQVDENR